MWINILSDWGFESNHLLEWDVETFSKNIIYLFESALMYKFFDMQILEIKWLNYLRSNVLEIELAYGSNIEIYKVCQVPIKFVNDLH